MTRDLLGTVGSLQAWLFDLDGVLTDTASVHDAAWTETFDQFLAQRAGDGAAFEPFDPTSTTGRLPLLADCTSQRWEACGRPWRSDSQDSCLDQGGSTSTRCFHLRGLLELRVQFRGSPVRVRVERAFMSIDADRNAEVAVGGVPFTARTGKLEFRRRGPGWEHVGSTNGDRSDTL